MLRHYAVSLLALLLPLPALAQVPPPPLDAKCFEIADWRDKKPLKKLPPFRATHIVAGPDGPAPVEVRQV